MAHVSISSSAQGSEHPHSFARIIIVKICSVLLIQHCDCVDENEQLSRPEMTAQVNVQPVYSFRLWRCWRHSIYSDVWQSIVTDQGILRGVRGCSIQYSTRNKRWRPASIPCCLRITSTYSGRWMLILGDRDDLPIFYAAMYNATKTWVFKDIKTAGGGEVCSTPWLRVRYEHVCSCYKTQNSITRRIDNDDRDQGLSVESERKGVRWKVQDSRIITFITTHITIEQHLSAIVQSDADHSKAFVGQRYLTRSLWPLCTRLSGMLFLKRWMDRLDGQRWCSVTQLHQLFQRQCISAEPYYLQWSLQPPGHSSSLER